MKEIEKGTKISIDRKPGFFYFCANGHVFEASYQGTKADGKIVKKNAYKVKKGTLAFIDGKNRVNTKIMGVPSRMKALFSKKSKAKRKSLLSDEKKTTATKAKKTTATKAKKTTATKAKKTVAPKAKKTTATKAKKTVAPKATTAAPAVAAA